MRGIMLMVKDFLENTIIGGIMIGLILTMLIIGGLNTVNNMTGTYTQYATVYVTDIDETLFIDSIGNVWSIEATDEYNEDEHVIITFDDNGTDNTIEDDIIVDIKKVN